MLVDVSSVVVGFFDQTIEILRSGGSSFDQSTGYYTPLPITRETRQVHIQPVTGKDMDKLRELHDVTEAVRVWSTLSFVLGKGNQAPLRYGVSKYQVSDVTEIADQMVWKDQVWEIRPILHWETGLYYEVTATI
jgi:hypothetical protein